MILTTYDDIGSQFECLLIKTDLKVLNPYMESREPVKAKLILQIWSIVRKNNI